MFNDYHFITHWRVRGTVDEIIDILKDAEDLPRWWPSVYIDVKQRGDIVELWHIRAEKPLLKLFTPILKPIFAANHRWAMARGEESLKIELARRHGEAPQATFR